jgi:hypothetical protein
MDVEMDRREAELHDLFEQRRRLETVIAVKTAEYLRYAANPTAPVSVAHRGVLHREPRYAYGIHAVGPHYGSLSLRRGDGLVTYSAAAPVFSPTAVYHRDVMRGAFAGVPTRDDEQKRVTPQPKPCKSIPQSPLAYRGDRRQSFSGLDGDLSPLLPRTPAGKCSKPRAKTTPPMAMAMDKTPVRKAKSDSQRKKLDYAVDAAAYWSEVDDEKLPEVPEPISVPHVTAGSSSPSERTIGRSGASSSAMLELTATERKTIADYARDLQLGMDDNVSVASSNPGSESSMGFFYSAVLRRDARLDFDLWSDYEGEPGVRGIRVDVPDTGN